MIPNILGLTTEKSKEEKGEGANQVLHFHNTVSHGKHARKARKPQGGPAQRGAEATPTASDLGKGKRRHEMCIQEIDGILKFIGSFRKLFTANHCCPVKNRIDSVG